MLDSILYNSSILLVLSSSQTVDLVFLYFIFHFHFLFLEQLGLELEVIGHTVTSVTI